MTKKLKKDFLKIGIFLDLLHNIHIIIKSVKKYF